MATAIYYRSFNLILNKQKLVLAKAFLYSNAIAMTVLLFLHYPKKYFAPKTLKQLGFKKGISRKIAQNT